MRVPTDTVPAAAAAPCIAHGRERVYCRACRGCSAFALSCFPPHPKAQAKGTPVTVGTGE